MIRFRRTLIQQPALPGSSLLFSVLLLVLSFPSFSSTKKRARWKRAVPAASLAIVFRSIWFPSSQAFPPPKNEHAGSVQSLQRASLLFFVLFGFLLPKLFLHQETSTLEACGPRKGDFEYLGIKGLFDKQNVFLSWRQKDVEAAQTE